MYSQVLGWSFNPSSWEEKAGWTLSLRSGCSTESVPGRPEYVRGPFLKHKQATKTPPLQSKPKSGYEEEITVNERGKEEPGGPSPPKWYKSSLPTTAAYSGALLILGGHRRQSKFSTPAERRRSLNQVFLRIWLKDGTIRSEEWVLGHWWNISGDSFGLSLEQTKIHETQISQSHT